MTQNAVTGNTGMVEYRWNKAVNGVATATILTCRDMRGRLDQIRASREERAHMAAFTASRVILVQRAQERGRHECRRRTMADAAIILRRYMDMGTCGTRLVGCNSAGMTGCTVVRVDTEMVKCNTRKGRVVEGIMTRRTIQRRGHMTGRLTDADGVVMTQGTIVYIDSLVSK